MVIAAFRAVLLLVSALALFHAVPRTDTTERAYGRDLVARYELPPEQVALYRAHAGPGAARAGRTPQSDPLQWVGPRQAVGTGRNPYKLVLTLHGTAPNTGDVHTNWQAGWEVRESLGLSRNLLMPIAALSSDSVAAGTPLTLTAVGIPVSFRGERQAAPTLNLVDARNFELHSVSVAVWSGAAPWPWPAMSAPQWALLLIGMLCAWAWSAFGRTPRPMARATSPRAVATTLPPPAADLQALPVHRSAMPPAPSVLSTTAALRDVLGAGPRGAHGAR